MIKNFMDNLEEKVKNRGISLIKNRGVLVIALFLVVITFVTSGCTGGGNADINDNIPTPASSEKKSDKAPDVENTDDVVVEPGAAKADLDTETVEPEKKKKSKNKKHDNSEEEDVEVIEDPIDKMVVVNVEDAGRTDPFLPYDEAQKAEEENAIDLEQIKLQYDLVDPPNSAFANSDAEKILTTKVSGIMYDSDSPSAILNIEGSDYLVRSGDVVNGYKILSIQPTVVTVQLGTNVYKAGVGQLLVTDGIQYNTISNLENKFGGAKK